MRVSQINGCAYCLDMHSKDALVDLTLLLVAINGWNRINVAARNIGGHYQVPKAKAA